MNLKIKNYLGVVSIVAVNLLVIAIFWYVGVFSKSVAPNRTFSVSGEGRAVAVPDIAELSLGVLTEGGKNLSDLQNENTKKVNNIISFLKSSGVEEKDIKTQSYNITPRYQYFACPPPKTNAAPCPPAEIVGYSINQAILIKVRNLNKTGEILVGAVNSGANTVSGPNFTVDNLDTFQNKAREEAIEKAKIKAKSIAKLGKFRLGKLINISEGIYLPPYPTYEASLLGKGGSSVESPSIESGSQDIKVNVTLVYEIK